MKNLLNIALVALVLIVLGCKCQQALDEMKNASSSPSPTASGSPSASPSATKSETPKPDTSSSTGVSKASFNAMKIGMKRREVDDLIGIEGTKLSASEGGGKIFSSYKWEGKNNTIITAVFEDDVLTNKYEANLK